MSLKEEKELELLEAMTKAGIAGPNYIGNRRDKKTMDIMEMQRNIKHNNEDLISFVDDMDLWMKDIEKKDKNHKLRDPNSQVRWRQIAFNFANGIFCCFVPFSKEDSRTSF